MAKKKQQAKKARANVQYDRWTSSNGLDIISGYLRSGTTIEELCKNVLKVSRTTFYKWCKKNHELQNVSLNTMEQADMIVENALFKKATGFMYSEECSTQDGPVMITRYAQPDVKAQQLWLMNRRSKNWKQKQVVEIDDKTKEEQSASRAILDALKNRTITQVIYDDNDIEEDGDSNNE